MDMMSKTILFEQVGNLRDECSQNLDALREQNRMIRDLEKRMTKVENPLSDEEREVEEMNVFVVTAPFKALAVYDTYERAVKVCQTIPGSRISKRRLMRGK